MKILLAGGGTAGHINPALAIAGYIREKRPDTEFLFIGNKDGMEQRLVPQAGFKIESIIISGFKRSFSPKNMLEHVKTVQRTFSASSSIISPFSSSPTTGKKLSSSRTFCFLASLSPLPPDVEDERSFANSSNILSVLAGSKSKT